MLLFPGIAGSICGPESLKLKFVLLLLSSSVLFSISLISLACDTFDPWLFASDASGDVSTVCGDVNGFIEVSFETVGCAVNTVTKLEPSTS